MGEILLFFMNEFNLLPFNNGIDKKVASFVPRHIIFAKSHELYFLVQDGFL